MSLKVPRVFTLIKDLEGADVIENKAQFTVDISAVALLAT